MKKSDVIGFTMVCVAAGCIIWTHDAVSGSVGQFFLVFMTGRAMAIGGLFLIAKGSN